MYIEIISFHFYFIFFILVLKIRGAVRFFHFFPLLFLLVHFTFLYPIRGAGSLEWGVYSIFYYISRILIESRK